MQQIDTKSLKSNSSTKRRVIAVASGVLAITAITCLVLLFVHSESQSTLDQTNNLSLPNMNKDDIAAHILSQKFISVNLQKKLLKTLFVSPYTQIKSVQRIFRLLFAFLFNVIDSNLNKSVIQKEWTTFVTALLPQDVSKYNPLFFEVNGGKAFNIDQFNTYLFKKLQNADFYALVPATPKEAILLNFAKLLINDKKNYELTYLFIFQIFDLDNNDVVTKDEFIEFLDSLDIGYDFIRRIADDVFQFAKDQKFSSDGKAINLKDFSAFAKSMQKPLQDELKNAKFLFKIKEKETRLEFIQILNKSKALFSSIQEFAQSFADLNGAQQKIIDDGFNKVISFEFYLQDTNEDKVVSQAENRKIVNSLFKNLKDREYFYTQFDSINEGKDINLQQFLDQTLGKMKNGSDFTRHVTLENNEIVQNRLVNFISKNHKAYELFSEFTFNLLDVDQNKIISLQEIQETAAIFYSDENQQALFEKNVKDLLRQINSLSIGNENSISSDQWKKLSQMLQPIMINQLRTSSTKGFLGHH